MDDEHARVVLKYYLRDTICPLEFLVSLTCKPRYWGTVCAKRSQS